MQYNDATPSQAQAKYLKKLSQEGRLTTEKIEEIMGEQKPNQIEKIKINAEKIQRLLPKEVKTEKETEEFMKVFEKICDKIPTDALKGYTSENIREFKEYKKDLKRNI